MEKGKEFAILKKKREVKREDQIKQ